MFVVGLSHKTAPIEIREKLCLAPQEISDALTQLHNTSVFSEFVVLSTCNRFEVYARGSAENSVNELIQFFKNHYKSISLRDTLYIKHDREAIEHLFRVSSGLDSLVVGETEILGQVKTAYQNAQANNTTGKVTNVLFQRALFVGKTVRTETALSEGGSSVGSMAVQLAEKIFGSLHKTRVLLLGAGEIAEITARHLMSQKTPSLTILNRTQEKAEELAKALKGNAGPLSALPVEIETADIVICSVTVTEPIVNKQMVETVLERRQGKPLYFIDLGVPRNVETTIHEFDDIYVYNVDDLDSLVKENLSARENEIKDAEKIILACVNEFEAWLTDVSNGRERALRHRIQKI